MRTVSSWGGGTGLFDVVDAWHGWPCDLEDVLAVLSRPETVLNNAPLEDGAHAVVELHDACDTTIEAQFPSVSVSFNSIRKSLRCLRARTHLGTETT